MPESSQSPPGSGGGGGGAALHPSDLSLASPRTGQPQPTSLEERKSPSVSAAVSSQLTMQVGVSALNSEYCETYREISLAPLLRITIVMAVSLSAV